MSLCMHHEFGSLAKLNESLLIVCMNTIFGYIIRSRARFKRHFRVVGMFLDSKQKFVLFVAFSIPCYNELRYCGADEWESEECTI